MTSWRAERNSNHRYGSQEFAFEMSAKFSTHPDTFSEQRISFARTPPNPGIRVSVRAPRVYLSPQQGCGLIITGERRNGLPNSSAWVQIEPQGRQLPSACPFAPAEARPERGPAVRRLANELPSGSS